MLQYIPDYIFSQMKAARPTLGVAVGNISPDAVYMAMYKSYMALDIETVSLFYASMIDEFSDPAKYPRIMRLTATTVHSTSTAI
jgi:hypothetical protein